MQQVLEIAEVKDVPVVTVDQLLSFDSELAEYFRAAQQRMATNAISMLFFRKYAEIKLHYLNTKEVQSLSVVDFLQDFRQLNAAQLLNYPERVISKIDFYNFFSANTITKTYSIDLDNMAQGYIVLQQVPENRTKNVALLEHVKQYKEIRAILHGIALREIYIVIALYSILFLGGIVGFSTFAKLDNITFMLSSIYAFMFATGMCMCLGVLPKGFLWVAAARETVLRTASFQQECCHNLYQLHDILFYLTASRVTIKAFEQSIMIDKCLHNTLPKDIVNEITIHAMGNITLAMHNLFSEPQQKKLFNYFNNKKYDTLIDVGDVDSDDDIDDVNVPLLPIRRI